MSEGGVSVFYQFVLAGLLNDWKTFFSSERGGIWFKIQADAASFGFCFGSLMTIRTSAEKKSLREVKPARFILRSNFSTSF